MLPQACAVMSLNGNQLLSATGKGVHVVVLEAVGAADAGRSPNVRSFVGVEKTEDISEWAKAVPDEALVLLAIVDPGDVGLAALFKLLTTCLGPQGLSLPRGCM